VRASGIVPSPMQTKAVRSAREPTLRARAEPLRIAFIGAGEALARHCPSLDTHAVESAQFALSGVDDLPGEVAGFGPDVTVVFESRLLPDRDVLHSLPGATVGVLSASAGTDEDREPLARLDRLLAFDPALTGVKLSGAVVWRAIPPPVSDRFFRPVERSREAPRAVTLGRSSEHREAMLMPAKHHHDLLQVVHGVTGDALAQLLADYEVGVHLAHRAGGGFGWQVGTHLASGQLLLSDELRPKHGLERNIDYLQFESPGELVWVLDRLRRFPEMHHAIRVRGRLKAEQYRASKVFARIAHDLLADVGAFGGAERAGA
jgi:hypothetical protein